MHTQDFKERRRHQRLEAFLEIDYRLVTKVAKRKSVHCDNMSEGGMKIRLPNSMPEGSKFKTLIHFPDDDKPVGALCEVVWCRRCTDYDKTKLYDIGLRHININRKDKERFAYLFCKMMINSFIFGK